MTIDTQEGDLGKSNPPKDVERSGSCISIVLSTIAVVLSALALVGTGFTFYQISELRQAMKELKTSVKNSAIAAKPADSTVTTPRTAPAVASPASPTIASSGIKPGQFVQSAFGTEGRVELISAKRIQDPDTGLRDVVNVQMRIRRLAADKVYIENTLNVAATTARNPETSQTYQAAGFDRSTGPVTLATMREGGSADAYVWLKIPEGVNTVDLFVPDTQVFKNVPISN